MTSTPDHRPRRPLASPSLAEAYEDFQLSRQAMQCSSATLAFYRYTAGAFLTKLKNQGVSSPAEVGAKHVREYLAGLVGAGSSHQTVHDHARAVRTLLRFWSAEGYLPDSIHFDMPRLERKRQLVLTTTQLKQVLNSGLSARDLALVQCIADSGLRRAEICALSWSDIEIASGLIRVRRGKGGAARSVVVGASTRRALLAYRRSLPKPEGDAPLFQSRSGARLTGTGLLMIFRRISGRTGIHVTAHALRRTFVLLALRGGMDVLHLQALLGHASLAMVQHYLQLVDDDLLQSHRAHGPIDNLRRLSDMDRTHGESAATPSEDSQ